MNEMARVNLWIEDRHNSVGVTARVEGESTVDVGRVTLDGEDGTWESDSDLKQVDGENEAVRHATRGRAVGHLVAIWVDGLERD